MGVTVRTLYLRNVPDDVAELLESLASEAGMSVSAYAVKGLEALSTREHNRRVFARLAPIDGPSLDDVVGQLHRAREGR